MEQLVDDTAEACNRQIDRDAARILREAGVNPDGTPALTYAEWERKYSAGRAGMKLAVDSDGSDEEEGETATQSPPKKRGLPAIAKGGKANGKVTKKKAAVRSKDSTGSEEEERDTATPSPPKKRIRPVAASGVKANAKAVKKKVVVKVQRSEDEEEGATCIPVSTPPRKRPVRKAARTVKPPPVQASEDSDEEADDEKDSDYVGNTY